MKRRVAIEEQGEQATAFSKAVLLGGLTLGFTESIPDGLSGVEGFGAGFVCSFLVLTGISAFLGRRVNQRSQPLIVECPHCAKTVEMETLG